ncbi:hypothetical protein EIP91_002585 [Steccherinum ochraceum]|uniref:Uncharacterized protein n=1 Tax=Steccherinum ochraceum TaxID=92696 RepID=A0A4R0RNM9_9APHY|nr:hypothetical protein EIP91_002585 [Steccherinum ochraceum]
MPTGILDLKISPTSRRTRSMSNDTSTDDLNPRFQQARRVDDGTMSVSPSVLSDLSARFSGQRRRVNPASLATRLGPELVKELESLLTPGMTEMPSFAARQAIQKKYDIDRRHIYDWYHTKGLRVSGKEKDVPLRGLEQEGKVLRSRIPQRLIKQRPAQIEIPAPSPAPTVAPSTSSSSSPSTPLMPLTPSSSYNATGYESGFPPTAFPIQCFFDEPLCIAPLDGSIGFPGYSEPLNPPASTGVIDRMVDWLAIAQDISHREDQNSPLDVPVKTETVFPISYEQPLPQNQREAYYRYLEDALGPANGVQESVGSYKTFMTQQVQTYYERLLPSDFTIRASSSTPAISSMSSTSVNLPETRSFDSSSLPRFQSRETDYGKWLLHGGRSLASSAAPSPASTLSGSQSDMNTLWLWGSSTTLCSDSDSMDSSLDIGDILESPVLRSRHPTAATSAPAIIFQPDFSKISVQDLLNKHLSEQEVSDVETQEESQARAASASTNVEVPQETQEDSTALPPAGELHGMDKMVEASATKRARLRSRRSVPEVVIEIV